MGCNYAYLGINGEGWVPAVGRDNLDDAVFLRLFANALNILHWVLELVGGRSVCGGLLETKHAVRLWREIVGRAKASALDGCEI
jgi:hypothetical protein